MTTRSWALGFMPAVLVIFSVAELQAEVRVWQGTISLPTYEEGPPDVNPPFDLFQGRSFVTYPYTTRENLTDHRSDRVWRTLSLENEYLKVVVLPDLGGRVYSCVDKVNGREMFYDNSSIKFAQVAFRGAWVALGIEFNFPVSHNWMTVSPVDFATVREPDGGASIWVGNIDRQYGMMWRVTLTLRPGSSLLEQTVTLCNRNDLRHRFYWWNTISVRVWDDSHIIYPMRFTASHGFTDVDTWPVDASGVDLSIPSNHTKGFVSRFSHGSREAFMGVYHPQTRSGMAHYAPFDEVPAKKIWSWGWDDEGRDWRKALSDDNSPYIEVQAGLFRNQETYAFLEPHQFLRFHEYYLPLREIGGMSRANSTGALNVEREPVEGGKKALRVGINVTRAISRGRIRISENGHVEMESPFNLAPSAEFRKTFQDLSGAGPYRVEMIDSDGNVLIAQTEGEYDFLPQSEVKTGPQSSYKYPAPENRSEGDLLELGKDQELNGKLLEAFETYRQGVARFPESFELNKAAGRLSVQLKRYDEAVGMLTTARGRIENDAETRYYLGLALSGRMDFEKARSEWLGAALLPGMRPAALLQLAQLAAQEKDLKESLRQVRRTLAEAPYVIRAGEMEVALLRHMGDLTQAKRRLAVWKALDEPNSLLRNESFKLGGADNGLWIHLAGDPERVIETAIEYMRLGFYEDAIELLSRQYPAGGAGEPGTALPQNYPLVAYYRGYCKEKAGESGRADFEEASHQSTRYVFPNRPETFPVLNQALKSNPRDAAARFLLGSLYLSGGRANDAAREWQAAVDENPRIPVLHRNLGLTLLHSQSDPGRALSILMAGLEADPDNVELYLGIDQCMSLLGRSPAERIEVLRRFRDSAEAPQALVFKLALALAEAGRADEAGALFKDRFFVREEFGTNVRQVYLEVQLRKALTLARSGKRDEAMAVARNIGRAVPDFPFTADGLTPFVESARFQYYLGELESLCGNLDLAARHWKKASEARGYAQIYFAWLAARRLGTVAEDDWQGHFRRALSETEAYLARGGHFPGSAMCAQGLILRALGEGPAAENRIRKALLLPDKGLSHYIARNAPQ